MIVDCTFPTLHGVPVHGAVSMDVTNDTRIHTALKWETAGSVNVVRVALAIHRVRRWLYVGCLQGKLQHRDDHHDDDALMEPRPAANAQLRTSVHLPKRDHLTPWSQLGDSRHWPPVTCAYRRNQ